MTFNQFETRYKPRECCCFTGHRAIAEDAVEDLKLRLTAELENLINRGVLVFIAGGALGFDTIAAQSVLALKGKYPFIKLVLALPCENQAERWSAQNKKVYDDILRQGDLVHYVNRNYKQDCMFDRNDYMVEYAAYCICYLRKHGGGTAYTVGYAKRMGRQLIML
ncbi:MAG: DUF1273 family protein [Clostridia bacterium]|nr:DUF1273 family protein [Clostridia bacterium]